MRICFLTPRFPFPPHKGDALRVYHQLRILGRAHEVTLLSMTDERVDAGRLAEVARLCKSVEVVRLSPLRKLMNLSRGLLSDEPLQVSYYRSPAFQTRLGTLLARGNFDAVHVTLIRMLPYVERLTALPVVVDLIDSLTLNLESRRSHEKGLRRWAYDLEYRRVRTYEKRVATRQKNLVVSSPVDQELLGVENVTLIPNGVDVDHFGFHGSEGRDPQSLVFTGNMGYQPNEKAVLWFAAEVWPRLRTLRPGLQFQVVGAQPSESLRALGRRGSGIQVTGAVPEVVPYLQRATVAVCPMQSGSGIQNKVLEAMSAGAPVVCTSIANRGVNGVAGRDLLLADDPGAFEEAVLGLLSERTVRDRLARAGRAWVESQFRWERHAELFEELYAGRRAVGEARATAAELSRG